MTEAGLPTYSELIKLELRVADLERVFRHYHVSQPGTDVCQQCGLDLRDEVHTRWRQA